MKRISQGVGAALLALAIGCSQSTPSNETATTAPAEAAPAAKQDVTKIAEVTVEEEKPAAAADPAEAPAEQPADAATPAETPETAPASESRYTSEQDKLSYTVGHEMAKSIKDGGIELNRDVFKKALSDTLDDAPLAMNDEQINEAMMAYRTKMMDKRMKEMQGGEQAPGAEDAGDAAEDAAPAETPADANADPMQTDEGKLSYSIGVQMGKSIKQGEVDVNRDVMLEAVNDVLDDKALGMSQQDMQATMRATQEQMMAKQQEKMRVEGAENIEKAETFLKENAAKEGVKILEEGKLQYEVLAEGSGESPSTTDQVTVHYKGTLLDGTQFDSSYDRGEPATFGLNQVIRGWTEAVSKMKPGAKWKLYIHPDWAYGAQGRPGIPPNALLVFEVELISIGEAQPPAGGINIETAPDGGPAEETAPAGDAATEQSAPAGDAAAQ